MRRRGASALEFALTLPVVMAILAGILEYGWYLFQLSNVVHAAGWHANRGHCPHRGR